jgi:Ser/Thr protein kinase RdoA (MazF antagonist)
MDVLVKVDMTEVIIKGSTVTREMHPASPSVHKLLRFLTHHGSTFSPEVLSVEGNHEVLSKVEGQSFDYPLQGAIASENALVSAASLLRQYHQLSREFIGEQNVEELEWLLPALEPYEVICHGDFAPYNVALTGNEVTGVFDFDTAHPAPRVWDLAYAVYCWAPFKSNNDDSLGEISDQIERAVLFCNAYQATEQQREALVVTMIARLKALLNFMKQQAKEGNTQFQQNLDDGHHLSYEKDIEYLTKNRQLITKQLLA